MTTNQQTKIEDFAKLQILTKEAILQAEIRFRSKLLNIYNEASQAKQLISVNWEQYTKFLRGAQWPSRRPKYRVSAVINYLIENIERKTALLTDTKPIPDVQARSDQLQDTADILNILISTIFEGSSFGQGMVDVVENSQVFGSGAVGTLFDKDGDGGRGDISTPSYDPRAVYFDPLVRKSYLLHDGEYVILEDIWALSKAQDMYPKRADNFKSDVGLVRFQPNQKPGFFSAAKNMILRTRPDTQQGSEIPRVYIREFWLKDRSKKNDKYRFKNQARKVVMVGDVIVDDGDNPYNDGEFPVDLLAWHTDFDSAWGWGDVELLKNPQELINKITAAVMENIALMSNAIWVGDDDALTAKEWARLNSAPGTYVKKRRGRELHREPGVALPAYVQQTVQGLIGSQEKITGMIDVMRGDSSGQVSSGVGIESLQLMAQALIRLRARSIEAMQARIGRKLISRIFQFFEPEKILEVLRDTESVDSELMKSVQTELLKPITERKDDAWTKVGFKIEPGSSLGLAKAQRHIESMKLKEMGSIDDEALLEDIEYPHRKKVLLRMAKKREAEAVPEVGPPAGSGGTQFPTQKNASPSGRTQ